MRIRRIGLLFEQNASISISIYLPRSVSFSFALLPASEVLTARRLSPRYVKEVSPSPLPYVCANAHVFRGHLRLLQLFAMTAASRRSGVNETATKKNENARISAAIHSDELRSQLATIHSCLYRETRAYLFISVAFARANRSTMEDFMKSTRFSAKILSLLFLFLYNFYRALLCESLSSK